MLIQVVTLCLSLRSGPRLIAVTPRWNDGYRLAGEHRVHQLRRELGSLPGARVCGGSGQPDHLPDAALPQWGQVPRARSHLQVSVAFSLPPAAGREAPLELRSFVCTQLVYSSQSVQTVVSGTASLGWCCVTFLPPFSEETGSTVLV